MAEEVMNTVDDFIDDPFNDEDYARFVLFHMRLKASMQNAFRPWMKEHPLFCTWKGRRFKVTGASRFGDIWLAKDFERECGYDHRVCIEYCSNWSEKPCHL